MKITGRKVYALRSNPTTTTTVYVLENGKMLEVQTLAEFRKDAGWKLTETHVAQATFVWMGRYQDKWGEDTIALFSSQHEADEFAVRLKIGRWTVQRVRLIT